MPKNKGKKIAIIVAATLVVLLVAAALIIPHLIDINQYHSEIQAQLEKRLGRQVSLGNMELSLFPPSFQVENAVIAEDSRFHTGRSFATAEKLAVSVKLWPLLHKDVEIKSLQLDRPHIELVKDAQGAWNFDSVGKQGKTAPGTKAPDRPSEQAGQFELSHLLITDGQVAITDMQQHQARVADMQLRQSRVVYDHIDLNVTDFAPDQQFSLKVSALLPGATKQDILLEGKAGPLQADTLKTPFDGRLRLGQVPISAATKFLDLQALNGIEAVISGEAKVRNSGGKLESSGVIHLDDTRVHNVNVGYPITLDYDITDDTATDLIQVRKGEIKLGSTPVTIAGTLNTKPTPAQIDLKLTAANASIGEAARLASAFGVAFGQGTDVTGQVNANVQASGAASHPIMNGQLSARNLVISGKEFPQPVKIAAIELTLAPDKIRSNDFTATTGSTSVNVNFALAQYSSASPSISASLRTANARLGEVLNIATAAGVSAVEGMSGEGQLGLDVRAQGPTRNLSELAFDGTGKIENATLKLTSLAKPVQIHNSDIRFSQNSVMLDKVSATVGQTTASGTLTLKNFAAPQVTFTLNADKVNVAEMQQIFAATPAPAKRSSAEHDFWNAIPQARAETKTEPSSLTKMTGSGTITVGAIQYDDLLLNNAHSNVTLDHGLISMDPVSADVYGGKESGTITMDMRPMQPVYSVNLKTDKVDANKLISSVSSLKQTLYGILVSNVNATFSSSSADSIARSLNGSLDLNLSNGKLMNMDLLHELATVGKFLGSSFGPPKNFTNLAQLSGNFDVKNGVAQTSNLKAVLDGGTMAATGTVNLADQSLNLHVTAVFTKAISQQVGGNQVGGYMNTALANNQGELVLPVIITGSFQHPQVAPDIQQIAQMKLQNLLPTSKSPGQLTTGILGAIFGNNQGNNQGNTQGNGQENTSNGQQQGQQQQQDGLGSLLNQVLNKKKKGQQRDTPAQKPPQ